jgi:hypothetical protein
LQISPFAYIISADMKAETLKKYAVPEVTLLAIFVIGLIISYAIVVSRSYIKLSLPLDVPAAGFSFSMPQGSGWQTGTTVQFEENNYYLTAVQKAAGDKVATRLTVMYVVAAGTIDANEWLAAKAAQMGGRIRDERRIEGKNILTCAAMLEMRGRSMRIFYGVAPLPGGRNVLIEVVDTADDESWGWEVLSSVAESFVFKGNPLLEEGQKIVALIRGKGLAQAMGISKRQEYFLVSEDGSSEGFEVNLYARAESDASLNVRMIDSYYVRSLGGMEGVLQTNDRFDRFLWISSVLSSRGARNKAVEMRLDDDATMSVRIGGARYAQEYVPGPAAIPDPLSPAVYREMIAADIPQAIIDFIDLQGRILPAIVQLQKRSSDANDGFAYVVTVKYCDQTGLSQELYLDADEQIAKGVVAGQNSYLLTRGSKETILAEFPLWLDYITSIEKLLEEDMPENTKNPRRIVRNVAAGV